MWQQHWQSRLTVASSRMELAANNAKPKKKQTKVIIASSLLSRSVIIMVAALQLGSTLMVSSFVLSSSTTPFQTERSQEELWRNIKTGGSTRIVRTRPPQLTSTSHTTAETLQNPQDDAASSVELPNGGVALTEDSVQEFTKDLTTVLKELRGTSYDPTLPRLFRSTPLPSFSNTWKLSDWERHSSRRRFLDYVLTFHRSILLRRILPQLTVLIAWSVFTCALCAQKTLLGGLFHKISIPLTPLSLVSTFVAGLLTLRSNQGLARLNEGRQAFGKVVLYTREMAQLIAAFIVPKNPQLGLLALRHVSLFGFLLQNMLRGKGSADCPGDDEACYSDDADIVRTMLRTQANTEFVMRQRKKPVAVCTRLRQIFASMHELNTAEEMHLDHVTQELNHCVMTAERIRNSPIPPLYTAHAGKLLIFYLVFLPWALRASGMLDGIGTIVTTTAVGFAMLGLDEISHLLEQPFKLMPLFQLSKNSMTDVGDSLVLKPPPLPGSEEDNGEVVEQLPDPPYW